MGGHPHGEQLVSAQAQGVDAAALLQPGPLGDVHEGAAGALVDDIDVEATE